MGKRPWGTQPPPRPSRLRFRAGVHKGADTKALSLLPFRFQQDPPKPRPSSILQPVKYTHNLLWSGQIWALELGRNNQSIRLINNK